ncbi:ABC transporter ATP-binding protein [Pollutimonas bauzanensis]|uniref:NitT/TauT family transport system ATP-binding protein n=1 Tax=Pollutimonas bauzanensis TaxID=658167 RepID=A0A1M5ZT59_9BURK|nr:ABC transporter ATP-binding protein [Pollutimonas bauzanensis]SHI27440.1 NitT/TauT family transport system ATP-binding protein [Pollutimonas bauzanensis]
MNAVPPHSGPGVLTLQAQGLRFAYPGQAPVFSDLSLQVRPGEIVALLGGSGCGKSTLLRGLSGLAAPQAGEVRFLGAPLTRPHPRAALIFQHASLLPWRDTRSNVAFGLDFKRQPRLDAGVRQRRVADALEAVGLADRARSYPAQLSGGQAQRVALARALVRQPALLFADEPFAALDAITRAQMQRLLIALVHRWQAAVLLVTHDIDEAIVVADRILLMGCEADGPARIVQEWPVAIERPREGRARAAAELHFEILTALQSLHA